MKPVKSSLLAFLFLGVLSTSTSFGAELFPEYTREQKVQLYSVIPFVNVETFLTFEAYRDLEVPLLVHAIDRTKLATGSVEFARLMQPTSDVVTLQRRRKIIDELLKNNGQLFHTLENTFSGFTNENENLFISLLDKNILPEMSVLSKLLTGTMTAFMSVLALGDSGRHIVNDRAAIRQAGWLNKINLARSFFLESIAGTALAYQAYENLQQSYQTFNEADQFVVQFAHALANMKKINEIIQSSPVLAASFPAFSDFEESSKINPALAWTLEKLETRASVQDSYWKYWSQKDSMMLYDGIKHLKMHFAPVLWWISRVDAYLSVIRWIKERQTNGQAVAFAIYNHESSSPRAELKELTSPVIPNAVENDFDIEKHVVFTGPHALGKTSSMRSIAYAYIMAQSITVVSAKHAELTPISEIGTYFNIGDSNGESSFQAELRHMTELLSLAKKNSPNKRILFLIDEPFAKTPSLVGNDLIERFLEKTVDIQNLSIILSSHLEIPARFAKEHPNLMENLQPELQVQDGKFISTYRMIPGAADWWLQNKNNQTTDYIQWLIEKKSDRKLWFK